MHAFTLFSWTQQRALRCPDSPNVESHITCTLSLAFFCAWKNGLAEKQWVAEIARGSIYRESNESCSMFFAEIDVSSSIWTLPFTPMNTAGEPKHMQMTAAMLPSVATTSTWIS